MEAIGGIILLIIIFCLFIKNKNLKNKNLELKEKLLERNIFVVESLVSLETLGEHYIDGDADPLPIDGCVVAYHKKNGRIKFDASGRFYSNTESIRGYQLHEMLLNQDVLNRNYLDFLIKHYQLIPTNWPNFIPFWGTVYRRVRDGHCFVKCLVRRDGVYVLQTRWLDSPFDSSMPAILK